MKKIFSIFAAALIALGFVGCEKNDSVETYTHPTTVAGARAELDMWYLLTDGVIEYLTENGRDLKAAEVKATFDKVQRQAQYAPDNLDNLNDCIDQLRRVCIPYAKSFFEWEKAFYISDLEDLLEPNDSEACRKIIDKAIKQIKNIKWNNKKDTLQIVDLLTAISDISDRAEEELEAQRNREIG